MRKFVLSIALGAMIASGGVLAADNGLKVKTLDKKPANMLIVGDSLMYYNCGMNAWLGGFVKAKENPKFASRIATIGGMGSHYQPVEEYLNNLVNRAHREKAPDAVLEAEKKALKKKYDTVVIQVQRFGEKFAARDEFYVSQHVKAIREYGATPVILLPFISKAVNTHGQLPCSLEEVTRTTIKTANLVNTYVIPVGIAYANAEKAVPSLNFYMPDKRHPVGAGSYLMAATIFASLFKKHPSEALAFSGTCEKTIPEDLRKTLCDVAWKTCQEFYGWKN